MGPGRLERPTSRLSGVRSNRLSYGPARARGPPPPPREGRAGEAAGRGGREGMRGRRAPASMVGLGHLNVRVALERR